MTRKKEPVVRITGKLLKAQEIDKIILIAMRLKNQINDARESNVKLKNGINIVYRESSKQSKDHAWKLKNGSQWMDLMLDGALDDIEYIVKHLKIIETIYKMESEIRQDKEQSEDEIINQTF